MEAAPSMHRAGEMLIHGISVWGPKISGCPGLFGLILFVSDFSGCKAEATTSPASPVRTSVKARGALRRCSKIAQWKSL